MRKRSPAPRPTPTIRRRTARIIGAPNPSKNRAVFNRTLTAYRRAPLHRPLTFAVLLVALLAAVASRTGGNVLLISGVTAAIACALHIAIKHPAAAKTTIIVAIWSPLTPYLASTWAVGTSGDVSSLFLAIVASGFLIALIAHRTSRGRPWLTVLLTLAALSFVGPLLLLPLPHLGLLTGYVPAALVLLARGGGIAWTLDAYETLRERIQKDRRRGPTLAEQVPHFTKDTTGENRTAVRVADLPSSFTVFHNLTVPGTDHRLHHLVVGPTGVYVIASYAMRGHITENTHGLSYNGQTLADDFGALTELRQRVLTELRLRIPDVNAIVVIHDAALSRPRTKVALSAANGKEVGTITVIGPETLLDELDPGIELLTKRRVRRIVRRARLRLTPRPHSGIELTPELGHNLPVATTITVLDGDGQQIRITDDDMPPVPAVNVATADPEVRFGQRVSLLTATGILPGARVAGVPFQTEDGQTVVPLCSQQAWQDAKRTNKPPVSFLAPLHAIITD